MIDEVQLISEMTSNVSGKRLYVLRVVASTQPLRCGLEFTVQQGTRGAMTLETVTREHPSAPIRCKWATFNDARTGLARECATFFAGLPGRTV